jgi:hypothetical protein
MCDRTYVRTYDRKYVGQDVYAYVRQYTISNFCRQWACPLQLSETASQGTLKVQLNGPDSESTHILLYEKSRPSPCSWSGL